MQKIFNKTTFTISFFTFGILLSFFSHYFPEAKILIWILLGISLNYLCFGWYLFKAYHHAGHPVSLFFMGYFYSGVFIAEVFAAADWPFAKTMILASFFWILAQCGLILVLRKKIPARGFVQFLIEAVLMFGMTSVQTRQSQSTSTYHINVNLHFENWKKKKQGEVIKKNPPENLAHLPGVGQWSY